MASIPRSGDGAFKRIPRKADTSGMESNSLPSPAETVEARRAAPRAPAEPRRRPRPSRRRGGSTARRTRARPGPAQALRPPDRRRPAADGRPRSASSRAARTMGDEAAKRRLIECNLRLVMSITRNYTKSRRPAPRPDPGGQPRPDPRGREVRLPAGLQALDVRDVVDPPGDHARARRPGPDHPPARARRRPGAPPDAHAPMLAQKLNREPTIEELASAAELPLKKVKDLLELVEEPVSLETPVGDGESLYGDLIEDTKTDRPELTTADVDAPPRARPRARQPQPAHAPRARAPLRPRRREAADARGGRRRSRDHARARPPARVARAARAALGRARPRALPQSE